MSSTWDMSNETDILRRDLIYHAEALADKLVIVALDTEDTKKIKSAITRANKFLQEISKYEDGDGTTEA